MPEDTRNRKRMDVDAVGREVAAKKVMGPADVEAVGDQSHHLEIELEDQGQGILS
jgi:hypothetical protein